VLGVGVGKRQINGEEGEGNGHDGVGEDQEPLG
jgi:hypothetical protein